MMRPTPERSGHWRGGRNASVLVGVLWCVAILTVVVIGVLRTARIDLRVGKNHGDRIQAHYLAVAGIEQTKALLYHDAADRRETGHNHDGSLYDSPSRFRDISLGRGRFRVIRAGSRDEGGGLVYGVADEESRLHLNEVDEEELEELRGMPRDVVGAILEYREQTERPFRSPRQLLMFEGLSTDAFLGEDYNQNGLLDREEDDGGQMYPPDNQDGVLDAGISGRVTVHSSIRNVNAAGQERVDITSADENALASVDGISSDLASAIVSYREEESLNNLGDLLDVVEVERDQDGEEGDEGEADDRRGNRPGAGGDRSGGGGPQRGDESLITEDLLMSVADDLTARESSEFAGPVNVNTAGSEVLVCLPGIDDTLARAIVSYRESAGFFENVASILKVPGMTQEAFKEVVPRLSARSETYRILCEGEVPSTGASKRIEVIVRVGSDEVTPLSYRENL